jgi:hypothetical protein
MEEKLGQVCFLCKFMWQAIDCVGSGHSLAYVLAFWQNEAEIKLPGNGILLHSITQSSGMAPVGNFRDNMYCKNALYQQLEWILDMDM